MNNLPNMLKPVPTNNPTDIKIFTSILSAETSSQQKATFVFRKQGLLSPKSRLVFSIGINDQTTSDNNAAFLPLNLGCAAAIDRCRILCGTRVLAESQSFNYYNSIRNSVHTAEEKKNMDMVLSGSVDLIGCSPATDGKYAVDCGAGIYTSSTSGKVADQYKLKKNPLETPEWSISLETLFPMLRSVLIPLQYLEIPISVEVEFTQQGVSEIGKVCCFNGTPPVDTSTFYDLNTLALHTDYIMYDDEYMENTRNDIYGSGISFRYGDLKTTTTNITGKDGALLTTGLTEDQHDVREIMSAGLVCRNVLIHEQKDTQEVSSITMTNQGSGYTSVPTLGISGGNGKGAVISIVLNTDVKGAALENPVVSAGGSGYSSVPSVSVSAPTGNNPVQAVITATINAGAVNGLVLSNAGNGYLTAPTITITGGGGTGATGTISVVAGGGQIEKITIDAKGTGYTSSPTIVINGGGGTGAAASVSLQPKTNPLLGHYAGNCPTHPSKINFRYNDSVVYSRRLENTSLKRNELQNILTYSMSCPSVIYSNDCENDFLTNKDGGQNPLLDNTCLFEGHSPVVLSGTKHYTGLQLRKSLATDENGAPAGQGTLISNTNVRYERDSVFSTNDFEKRTIRFFTEYERDAILQNGEIIVSS